MCVGNLLVRISTIAGTSLLIVACLMQQSVLGCGNCYCDATENSNGKKCWELQRPEDAPFNWCGHQGTACTPTAYCNCRGEYNDPCFCMNFGAESCACIEAGN